MNETKQRVRQELIFSYTNCSVFTESMESTDIFWKICFILGFSTLETSQLKYHPWEHVGDTHKPRTQDRDTYYHWIAIINLSLGLYVSFEVKLISPWMSNTKLYIPSTLNIDRILWHTQLIVYAVKQREFKQVF